MDYYSFRHVIFFLASLVFVLVWIAKNIDYENLKKWRWGVFNENWTWQAKSILAIIIIICTIAVYMFMISVSN